MAYDLPLLNISPIQHSVFPSAFTKPRRYLHRGYGHIEAFQDPVSCNISFIHAQSQFSQSLQSSPSYIARLGAFSGQL